MALMTINITREKVSKMSACSAGILGCQHHYATNKIVHTWDSTLHVQTTSHPFYTCTEQCQHNRMRSCAVVHATYMFLLLFKGSYEVLHRHPQRQAQLYTFICTCAVHKLLPYPFMLTNVENKTGALLSIHLVKQSDTSLSSMIH